MKSEPDEPESQPTEKTMKFLDRLSLLVKADAHGVLEHLEERTLLAKQHLREAELELDRKRALADALGEETRRLSEEAVRIEKEMASLDDDVELALAGEKEELARFSVRKLIPLRRTAADTRQRISLLDEQRSRLAETLAVQEQQFEELRHRVRTQLAAARSDECRVAPRAAPAADEEVELEILRRRATAGAR